MENQHEKTIYTLACNLYMYSISMSGRTRMFIMFVQMTCCHMQMSVNPQSLLCNLLFTGTFVLSEISHETANMLRIVSQALLGLRFFFFFFKASLE